MQTDKNNLCIHYDDCGGCSSQHIDYDTQLKQKEEILLKIFKDNHLEIDNYEGIIPSPEIFEYRNNMEFSFGDLKKGGILQLGMHPRGKRFDVITVDHCLLVDNDFRIILKTILDYCRNHDFKKYHIKTRKGFLRNLVIRKGINTGEVIANLITTSQNSHDFSPLADKLYNLNYKGNIVGFIQTINDNYSDAVISEKEIIYRGRNCFYDKLLGLNFKINSLSFFQTNTHGAEKLYAEAKEYVGSSKGKNVFDLYCGAGTISQVIASEADNIIGIEIDEEAVKMAEKNAALNNIENCSYIAGDVLEKIDEINEKADLIIIDPPRPGINPKALEKIASLNTPEILYISCNPKSLARDLVELDFSGYKIESFKAVDMFPHTKHLETVVYLKKET
ncbi:MAG: 23S rRNA (uracil(1939)-C(5))-methyltransferase RlmD [Bacillota bacterium]